MFIGVDLGTSAVKLLAMTSEGKILKTLSVEYPISFPKSGWSEQSPEDWYKGTIKGIKELLDQVCSSNDIPRLIEGLGIGGQMHGLVILDKDNNVIRPAILWNDGRTTKETAYLNEVIGQDKLSQYTGNIAFAGFTAPKILWVKNNEPDNFAKIEKIMLPKDYIVYRLTGAYTSDYSDASGMLLMDVKNKCWSKEMLEICGVSHVTMPELHDSFDVVGEVKESIAAEFGLSSNASIKVVAGAGDNAAAAVGTGTVGAGGCNLSLGTSGTLFISNDSFTVDDKNSLHSFAHADGGYHLMGCMLSAASCNKWWMDQILQTKDYAGSQKDIVDNALDRLGNNNVFFMPYLMGERSPHNNPLVRAGFLGMSMDTTREDMVQAVLEGVAFGLRDSLEVARSQGIIIESSNICGGGAKSPLWRQIIANVMNVTLTIQENDEGPALGGAILAAVGCKVFDSVQSAADKLVKVVEKVEPNPELVARYEEKYKTFKTLYPMIKDLYK
ncbi:MAG: xylulokinase [Eubacterium sp.]|nr:xylulokinase [Eubacterium sp.]